jgi:hypothetical protein
LLPLSSYSRLVFTAISSETAGEAMDSQRVPVS